METSNTAGREPTIVVREPDAATKRAPQNNQLMSERGILSLKPDLRLERRGQHGQDKPDEPDHRGNLADSSLNKPELGFRYTQGGLGHLAVQFLAKMGCEVTAISSTHSKEEEARQLGASRFIATKKSDEVQRD